MPEISAAALAEKAGTGREIIDILWLLRWKVWGKFMFMFAMRCVFLSAAALAWPVLATAQTDEEITACTSSLAAPEKRIAGCTALIRSREYQGEKLSSIYNYRAGAYMRMGDLDKAIADYNQAILRDISNSDFFYNRGIAYTRKGNFDHAISDQTHALNGFDPAKHPWYYKRDYFKARGDAYRGKQDYAKAVTDYSEAIKLDPTYARAIYNRGEVKLKLGDKDGGTADIAKAKELQDDIGPEQ